jgi:L-methionine (R)-S-oxide reductase
MSSLQTSKDRATLLVEIHQLAAVSTSLTSLQQDIVESISQNLPHYNWTGFYMLDPPIPKLWSSVHSSATPLPMCASR